MNGNTSAHRVKTGRKKAMKPDRLFSVLAWAIFAFLLLAILAVQIDERYSRRETEWAKQTREMVSVKLSEGD